MDFLALVGLAFVLLGIAGLVDRAIYRFGPSWRRALSIWWWRFRLWRLDRRATALAKRYGYRRDPSMGTLKRTRSRAESFYGDGPPEV
jgi:hypothetical protein